MGEAAAEVKPEAIMLAACIVQPKRPQDQAAREARAAERKELREQGIPEAEIFDFECATHPYAKGLDPIGRRTDESYFTDDVSHEFENAFYKWPVDISEEQ